MEQSTIIIIACASAAISAIPPTIAALASLIATLQGNNEVAKVHRIVNGEKARMLEEIGRLKTVLGIREQEEKDAK